MKDLLDFIKTYGIDGPLRFMGVFTSIMIGLMFIPSLNYIPKAFFQFVVFPFMFGK